MTALRTVSKLLRAAVPAAMLALALATPADGAVLDVPSCNSRVIAQEFPVHGYLVYSADLAQPGTVTVCRS